MTFDVRASLTLLSFQTDVAYFTSPIAASIPASPVQTTVRTKVAAVVPSLSVPEDLVTPRDFKPLARIAGQSKPPDPIDGVLKPMDSDMIGDGPPSSLKHPAEREESLAQAQPGPAKPRMPPAKRPKQTSIFIPKSNKKVKQTSPLLG